jgi:hypothetical protein
MTRWTETYRPKKLTAPRIDMCASQVSRSIVGNAWCRASESCQPEAPTTASLLHSYPAASGSVDGRLIAICSLGLDPRKRDARRNAPTSYGTGSPGRRRDLVLVVNGAMQRIDVLTDR